MAITAVAAGFFRRGVVVDIINWPVSLYFVHREANPRAGNTCPNLIGAAPLVQTFAVIANGTYKQSSDF